MAKTNSVFPSGVESGERVYEKLTVTTSSTAGAVTYTAAEILGGVILRDPNGGNRSDVFPTAASIETEAGLPGLSTGASFTVLIRNTADAAETITMSTATGLTLSGTMTIAQNNQKEFLFVKTGVNTFTVYSLGTVVF